MAARKQSPPEVDERYGLEPVIEPGDLAAAGDCSGSLEWQTVQCPYCGEAFETVVDLSSGSAGYIEDCQVCCQPLEFNLEVGNDGTIAGLQVGRSD